MARKILAQQKDLNLNRNKKDYIDISVNEETEQMSIAFTGAEAKISDGVIECVTYFAGDGFRAGTGSYPYDRTHLVDAFFHCVLYQSKAELYRTTNPSDDIQYIDIGINSAARNATTEQLTVTVNMSNLPVTIELVDGYSRSKGKSYLENFVV